MTIELITFDLDDTLWDTAPVIMQRRSCAQTWLADPCTKIGRAGCGTFQALRQQVLLNEPQLKHRISALRRRVLFHALQRPVMRKLRRWQMMRLRCSLRRAMR
jgi:FMN hydrolase / 5-amino-6-(5-phospho-D-ribitylamino)uracil phosphatase